MSGTRSDAQPHYIHEASHSAAMNSAPPNTSHAGAVSDADNNCTQVKFRPHSPASVPQISSPARALLDLPRLGAAAATMAAAATGPSGLDVLNTAVEARMDQSREEAALALVGLTTALPLPSGGIVPAHHCRDNGKACSSATSSGSSGSSAATPRPSASASAAHPSARPSTVVTPGSGGSKSGSSSGTSKPRGKLTYVRGVGLVSGEISDDLVATLAAASSLGSPETPSAPAKPTPAPRKKKGTAKRARGGSAKKKCHDGDTATPVSPATAVVTPAPASASAPTPPHPRASSLQLRTDGWTNYELGRLVQAVHHHDQNQNWEAIGTFVGTRSAGQCRTKWEDRTEWEGRWREENGRFLMPEAAATPPTGTATGEEGPDACMGANTANARAGVQKPRSPKKTSKKTKSPGRPRKQPAAAAAADGSKSPSKSSKKKPQQKKKTTDGGSPGRSTYSREKLVTADGKNRGDWNDDETARLQRGIQALESNWRDIAQQYVPTRTKQQCKSKNQKMVRSDGDDWHTKTFLSLRKVRRPLSEPSPKRALQVEGDGRRMDPPVEKRAKASKKRGPRRNGQDLPSLPPLPPAVPPALPPPQIEEKEVEVEGEQTKITDSVDKDASPADRGALNPPVPPPSTEDESNTSGRRLSKRRPKRSVAEIREEFEAKQDMKQTMTKKAKVQDTTGATKPASKTKVAPDITNAVAESVPTRPRRRAAAKAQKVVAEVSVTEKKKESKKIVVASAKKATAKAAAKKGSKKYEYPRCTTPGCTRQRQGGCAGQCRKHFNEDRVKAGLEVAKTYVKTCKREGCNKLKQWGFGEYCRAHHKEELKQKGELCSVPSCKKQPVQNCDGMCTVHYKKRINSNEKYLFSRTKIRGPDGNRGDWDDDEVQRFYEGMGELTGDTRKRGDWEVVAAHVGTRSASQCRSKYQKLQKKRQAGVELVPV